MVRSSAMRSGLSMTPSLSRKSSKEYVPSGSAAMLPRISSSARAESAVERGSNGVVAVFVEQRVQAALAEIERVDLAVQIAPIGLRHARIGGENIDDVLLHARRARDELHRRNAHALLKAFGRLRVVVARHVAADVEPVTDRGEPGEHACRSRISGRTRRKSLRCVPPS